MLARVVEFRPSSEAAAQFTKLVEVTVLGIVHTQAGCVAAFVQLHGESVLGVSIWQSIAAAERYGRECYPDIVTMLRPFLMCDPKVSTFDTRELNSRKLPPGIHASILRYLQSVPSAA